MVVVKAVSRSVYQDQKVLGGNQPWVQKLVGTRLQKNILFVIEVKRGDNYQFEGMIILTICGEVE
jgi:hypothetical protein